MGGNSSSKRKQFEKALEAALEERKQSEKGGTLCDKIKALRERHRVEFGDSHSPEATADAIIRLRDEWKTVDTEPKKCTIREIKRRCENYEENTQRLDKAYRRNKQALKESFERSLLFLDKQYEEDTKDQKSYGTITVIKIKNYLETTELRTSVWQDIKLEYYAKKSRRVARQTNTMPPPPRRLSLPILGLDRRLSLPNGRRRSSFGSGTRTSEHAFVDPDAIETDGDVYDIDHDAGRRLAASDPCIHAGFALIPIALLLFFILRRWRSTSKPQASPQPEDELEAEYDRMHALL